MGFFFKDTATTEIYTLSLHDALPISLHRRQSSIPTTSTITISNGFGARNSSPTSPAKPTIQMTGWIAAAIRPRSEEHTSELQSRQYLVCRLLLEKKRHFTSLKTITPV